MKSLQVARGRYDPSGVYSDLCVLKSTAGFYIGTLFMALGGIHSPGSRDSCYFATEEDAKFALELCKRMYKHTLLLRTTAPADPQLSDEEFSADFSAALFLCGLDRDGIGYRLEP
jgi:hypothetical protein